jgi:cell fate regulator YaaT (PSP1 superfamily)
MELPGNMAPFEYAEIRFKNSRKEFFRNSEKLSLNIGDAVVVEGNPGYDLGLVSVAGELARLQMEKKKETVNPRETKKILRKAGTKELEIWREARSFELTTMRSARKIASSLNLDMKISDVEYQGDKTKATFYYTAEGRVDFRELIRKYAESFRVRIEMKQIGARQEAARLGGIGSCGRELCCSTWLTDFRSVSTGAARYQQLALNAAKLAGQCGKLKCCLNYELDAYLDALKQFPKNHGKLKTKKGTAIHVKTDIFKGIIWYVLEESNSNTPIALHVDRVRHIIEMNEKGTFPEDLKDFAEAGPVILPEETYTNVVGQDSLTRFDTTKSKKKKKKKGPNNRGPKQNAENAGTPKPDTTNRQNTGSSDKQKSRPRGGKSRRKPNNPL